MFGIAQAPAKQTAADAINTLSGRLQSATLLEDRRNAVLGLRSFARQYPASVASGALRGLIGSLVKDFEDVDTVKAVLETLLMLFNPDGNSPEASEEIALWLADEFTQHQENITILLDLLEASDFYSRLYSLQLLTAILSARTERTEECIFTAPLGISKLVAILDDRREAIRNEGLTLLTFLTPNSSELQKLVAFENAFDRIFTIIKLEGSLAHGDRIVEDCLIFLANLLRQNVSNQSFFRETGYIPKLSRLLSEASNNQGIDGEVAEWVQMQRNRNIYALLAVLRLFLVSGGVGTNANQSAFWQNGIVTLVLELAFNHLTETQIKTEALITCADLIRGNANIQEGFAQLQVTSVRADPTPMNGSSKQNQNTKVFVIDGLLDLTLDVSSISSFDSRLAACECIKAYFFNHRPIRLHFLRRAIEGHSSGADETSNVFTTLLSPGTGNISSDPYRQWLAAVIVFHLVFDDGEAKEIAMNVAEGDASKGEEVVTCIQTITANLISALENGENDRVLVGYLMLLSGWLFEDLDSVNDFLGEGSNVHSLVQAELHGPRDSAIVQGLCTMLLGIVYEFSTKDSPIPRAMLYPILSSRMGREQYIDHLTKLRRHPLLRDFDILPQRLSSAISGGFPEVYFDKAFVDFFQDNFSRLIRAIDKDPNIEVSVVSNGVQKGISRELVDNLRTQLDQKDKGLQSAQSNLLSLERQLIKEQNESRESQKTAILEITRIKALNDALQRHHDDELNKIRLRNNQEIEDLQSRLKHMQKSVEIEADYVRDESAAETKALKETIQRLEANIEKTNNTHTEDLQRVRNEFSSNFSSQKALLDHAMERAGRLQDGSKRLEERLQQAEISLADKEDRRAAAQNELDDLLMVFADLEEKAAKYKKRLRDLGEPVSDGDDELGDAVDEAEPSENEVD